MDDLQFYILFNSVSVLSEQWEVDNERLCAMELHYYLRRFRLDPGSNLVHYISRPVLNSYLELCSSACKNADGKENGVVQD